MSELDLKFVRAHKGYLYQCYDCDIVFAVPGDHEADELCCPVCKEELRDDREDALILSDGSIFAE